MLMERSWSMLRALFAGVEPIIIGLVANQQRLVLLGLCNLCIILLFHSSQSQTKSPLANHIFSYRSQLQNLKTQNNYFWAIAFLWLIGWIIGYVLQQWDQFDKVALALITAGLIYWILSSVIHGLKVTWSSALSKLFGLIILVGLGRAFLWSNNWQNLLMNFPKNITKLFTIPTAEAPTITTGAVETGAMTTGVVVSQIQTGSNTVNTGIVATGDTSKALTYADVVPAIVKKYSLPAWPDVGFANISKTSDIYTAFKAWYAARFFGLGVNPKTLTTCNVYFVMLWLAEKWPLTYTSSTVFNVYAAEAEKQGKTYGCKPGDYVTEDNLPQ
jgi:hypothetical protein